MRLMLASIFRSILMLINTTVVFCFYLLLFVVSGIQFYSGALENKCHWLNETALASLNETALASLNENGMPFARWAHRFCIVRPREGGRGRARRGRDRLLDLTGSSPSTAFSPQVRGSPTMRMPVTCRTPGVGSVPSRWAL